MVLNLKRVAVPLQVGGEVLAQVLSIWNFKYLLNYVRVMITSEGKMETPDSSDPVLTLLTLS